MSRTPTPRKSDYLTDPARAPWRAGQRVAALEDGWTQIDAPPEGEALWREDGKGGDSVRLTPDGWLVYVGHGQGGFYTARLRATPELVAAMRGESGTKLRRTDA